MKIKTTLTALITTILLAGCANGLLPAAHRHGMQQGNMIEPSKIRQLQLDMSTEQVRYLLGNPVIANRENDNQWLYSFSAGKLVEPGEPQLLMVEFNNGHVVTIENDYAIEESLKYYRANVASDFD